MSSISGSGSGSSSNSDYANKSDELRRQREAYQKSEAEESKKTAKDIRHLNESHSAELEQLQKEHSQELDALKDRLKDSISSRDMQYQKEMDEMREMYRKDQQRHSGDSESKFNRTDKSLKEENDRLRVTSERQADRLRQNFDKALAERDQSSEETAREMREEQGESRGALTKNLNKTHETERDQLIKARDRTVGDQQRSFEDYRRNSDQRIAGLEKSQREEKARLLSTQNNVIKQLEEDHSASAQLERDQNSATRSHAEFRQRQADQAKEDTEQKARDGLSGSVDNRYNSKINQLKSDLTEARRENLRQSLSDQTHKKIELTDLRDSMQTNIEGLERSREQTVDASNKRNGELLDKVNKNHDEQLTRTNRFYQEKITAGQDSGENRVNQLQADHSKTQNHDRTTTETRFARLKQMSDVEQGKMRSYFERAGDSMHENFDEQLRMMRLKNRQDQEQLFASVQKQTQEADSKFQGKLTDIAGHYEAKMAEIQEVHEKELHDQKITSDRGRNEVVKKASVDLASQASQYEYRLAKLEESQRHEMKELNAKHQQSLANLTKNKQG